MKQTVNPVHLLSNNNRLHKQIVWAPCVFTTQNNSPLTEKTWGRGGINPQERCSFDVIGSLNAKFFQIWLSVASYGELWACFYPIRIAEIFCMNKKYTYNIYYRIFFFLLCPPRIAFFNCGHKLCKGLFTWRGEDPTGRIILVPFVFCIQFTCKGLYLSLALGSS